MSVLLIHIAAIVCSVCDSIGKFVPGAPIIFCWIGKSAAPLMLYCMTYGIERIKKRGRYMLSLYIGSVVMSLLNLIFSGFSGAATEASGNLFSAMFASACLIILYEYTKKHPKKAKKALVLYWGIQLFGAAVWCVLSEIFNVPNHILKLAFTICGNVFLADGALLMVLAGLVFYVFRKQPRAMRFFYCMICFVFFLSAATGVFGRFLSLFRSDSLLVVAEVLTGLSMYGIWVAADFSMDHLLFYDFQWMIIGALPLLCFAAARQEEDGESWQQLPWIAGILYPLSFYFIWFTGNYLI